MMLCIRIYIALVDLFWGGPIISSHGHMLELLGGLVGCFVDSVRWFHGLFADWLVVSKTQDGLARGRTDLIIRKEAR